MEFAWDDRKNRANIEKHGVGFALACRIFEGPVMTLVDARFDYGEIRQLSIGAVQGVVVLAVVHTDRDGTTRRIISARRANRRERSRYEQAIRS